MSESIPVGLVEDWINELQSMLKQERQESKSPADLWVNKGMRHGIAQIQRRITTWCRHQEKLQTLNRLGRKFLMVRRINLSDGRYRKLEWYENHHFLTLAWRHGMHEEIGELMLEMQHVQGLSTKYLVYKGDLSFDDLVELARKGGLDAIKNEETQGEWVEKVWT